MSITGVPPVIDACWGCPRPPIAPSGSQSKNRPAAPSGRSRKTKTDASEMEKIRAQKNDSVLPLAEKRREYVTVWMTPAEKAAAVENARRAALPMSSFSRKVLLEAVVPQAAPSPDWMRAYSETARWSGLLNQIAHQLNSASLQGLLESAISSRCSDLEFVISAMAQDADELRAKILKMAS